MQPIITITGWNLAAVFVMMIIGWLISLRYRNVSIVDSLWGLGFVLIAWITFFHAGDQRLQFLHRGLKIDYLGSVGFS